MEEYPYNLNTVTGEIITCVLFSLIFLSGRVYVHCQQGVSRSASIVLAFLMLKRSMNIKEAVKTVRAKREIFPNDGFLKQLCELNETLNDETPS